MRGFDRPRSPALAWLLRPLLVEIVPRDVRVRRAARSLDAPPSWAGPTSRAVVHDQARDLASRAYAHGSRFDAFATRPHRMHLAWLRHQEEVASGVARVDPYLDLDLVRAVTSLPPSWLVRGARRRGLLRDALRGDLPESVRERADKASFEPALERFLAAAGGPAILRPYVLADRLAALGIVEPALFAEAAASFLQRPSPEDWVTVWPALASEAFLRARERR
jgi:asparagine synthase (glutamine-hydrolysing)